VFRWLKLTKTKIECKATVSMNQGEKGESDWFHPREVPQPFMHLGLINDLQSSTNSTMRGS